MPIKLQFLFFCTVLWRTVKSAHPLLVECYCGIKISDDAEVWEEYDPNAEKELKVKNCLGDVFGESGIRWYIDGPFDPNIKYEERKPVLYETGHAWSRLHLLGYVCHATRLFDPKQDEVLLTES